MQPGKIWGARQHTRSRQRSPSACARRTWIYFLPLLALVLSGLSCQAAQRMYAPATLTAAPPNLPASPTPSLPPTSTTTPWASPTPQVSDTPTPTSTPPPTAAPWQLQVFEELWNTVNDNYLYADFNGVDWQAVYQEFKARVQTGMNPEVFYHAMREMIALLGDEHSTFLSPEEVKVAEARYAGQNDFVGIGILSFAIPERGRLAILLVFPGSPAAGAGLRAHDSVLAVNGMPIIGPDGVRRDLIRGPEGTSLELTVQTPGEEPRTLVIIRQRVTGALPVPYQVLESPQGQRIGYLLLTTFSDSTVDEQVQQALQAMNQGGRLEGLIIDNRYNGGGISPVVQGTLGYFTGGTLGHYIDRDQERPFMVEPLDVGGSQEIPLVVLVGSGTASFGEIFAGVLHDLGRAYLIGETTEGNVEVLRIYNFSDGSRAQIAKETFRPLNNPGEDWEITGIIPDQAISSYWDQVTTENDPVIWSALEYFDRRDP